MAPNRVDAIEKILFCVDKIENSVDHLEEINNNGGLPETVDSEEVERWQRNSLNGSSEKSGDA
jgi:hypothetical protein